MKIERFQLFVLIALLLLGSTLITWSLYSPSRYGASNTLAEADEVEVIWFNAQTVSDEILRISYVSEAAIEIYIVTQGSYNLSAREIPEEYVYHYNGNSSTLNLNGYLPFLYYIVVSEIDQYVYIQSWVLTPTAQFAEVAVLPLATLTVAVIVVACGWYVRDWKLSVH